MKREVIKEKMCLAVKEAVKKGRVCARYLFEESAVANGFFSFEEIDKVITGWEEKGYSEDDVVVEVDSTGIELKLVFEGVKIDDDYFRFSDITEDDYVCYTKEQLQSIFRFLKTIDEVKRFSQKGYDIKNLYAGIDADDEKKAVFCIRSKVKKSSIDLQNLLLVVRNDGCVVCRSDITLSDFRKMLEILPHFDDLQKLKEKKVVEFEL